MRTDAITVEDVDGLRFAKVREHDVIEHAAAKGKPVTQAYTDANGRTRKRRRRALNATSISIRSGNDWNLFGTQITDSPLLRTKKSPDLRGFSQ